MALPGGLKGSGCIQSWQTVELAQLWVESRRSKTIFSAGESLSPALHLTGIAGRNSFVGRLSFTPKGRIILGMSGAAVLPLTEPLSTRDS